MLQHQRRLYTSVYSLEDTLPPYQRLTILSLSTLCFCNNIFIHRFFCRFAYGCFDHGLQRTSKQTVSDIATQLSRGSRNRQIPLAETHGHIPKRKKTQELLFVALYNTQFDIRPSRKRQTGYDAEQGPQQGSVQPAPFVAPLAK